MVGPEMYSIIARPFTYASCRSAKKWRVQDCQRGAFVRLIGPNVDPPVWDCPAFGATTITEKTVVVPPKAGQVKVRQRGAFCV